MAVNTKAITRRLKSISNTRKITKAMEMVAASKMRKAVNAALETRAYASSAWNLLVHLSRTQKNIMPLLQIRPIKKILLILITSNRGLCGSFNSNIIRKTAEQLKNPTNLSKLRINNSTIMPAKDIIVDVVGIGKKGADFAKKMQYNLLATFTNYSDTPSLTDALPVSQMVISEYEAQKYDKVVIAYSDYKSALLQEAKLRQVLPISEIDLEKMIQDINEVDLNVEQQNSASELILDDFLFEPNKEEVLKIILPRLVESQIYQALLESSASEHSARMMAMRNANEAAGDMVRELNLNFNKARQAGITQEIAEIAGGAAALE